MLSFALLVTLNFDRSTVKHALQNMQNYATSGFLTALEQILTANSFSTGAPRRPGPRWGSLQRSPDLAGLRGVVCRLLLE